MNILKRILNISTLAIAVYTLVVLWSIFQDCFFESCELNFDYHWDKILGVIFWGVIIILVLNYIIFNKITLWHKNK